MDEYINGHITHRLADGTHLRTAKQAWRNVRLEVNKGKDHAGYTRGTVPTSECGLSWTISGLQPLLAVTRMVGLAPVLTTRTPRSLELDASWERYSKFLFAAFVATTTTLLCMNTPLYLPDAPLDSLVFVPLLMKGTSAAIVLYTCIIMRHTQANALRQLVHNDVFTEVLAHRGKSRLSSLVQTVELVGLVLVAVLAVFHRGGLDRPRPVSAIALEILSFQVIALAGLQYVDMVTLLWLQLRALNQKVAQMFKLSSIGGRGGQGAAGAKMFNTTTVGSKAKVAPGPTGDSFLDKVSDNVPGDLANTELLPVTSGEVFEARVLHRKLRRTFNMLDSVYGMPMLLIMMITFTDTTITLYDHLVPRPHFSTPAVLWVLVLVSGFYGLLTPCQRLKNASEETCEVVQRALIRPDIAHDIRLELREFSFQLLNRDMTFTAFGFFPLDYTQIASVIGTVTTYLVILIQFQHQVPNPAKSAICSCVKTTTSVYTTPLPSS